MKEQESAIERMREMNRKSSGFAQNTHKMPPAPPFVKIQQNSGVSDNIKDGFSSSSPENTFSGIKSLLPDIPVLNSFLKEPDSALLLGLLLILISENCDRLLLYALVYILM